MSNYSIPLPCGCSVNAYDGGRKEYTHTLQPCALHGAAPELFQACKEARRVLATAIRSNVGIEFDVAENVTVKLLDAAIQKARAKS